MSDFNDKTRLDTDGPSFQASRVEQPQDADGATVVDANLADAQSLPEERPGELSAGQVLGKVRIEKLLGRGGMGAVYRGTHTTLDVPVAVKILPPEIAAQHSQFAERFMREARLAARIKHPNVMGVLDADRDPKTGLYYIVLEFVGGGSVRDLMRKGVLSEAKTVDIALSVAQALEAAADFSITHRDIKPDNIMLTEKGQVKLADMGIAKQHGEDDQGITMSSAMMGTPAYISPEQAMDAKHADARADIYSLGASMYHMLVGAPPYEGETTFAVLTKLATDPTPDARARRPDLCPELAELVMQMMDKDKNRRPQTAKELVERLTLLRSRIATSATAMVEGGQVKLNAMPALPRGTDTQGIAGTAVAAPTAATAAGVPPSAARSDLHPTASAPMPGGERRKLPLPALIGTLVAVVVAPAMIFTLLNQQETSMGAPGMPAPAAIPTTRGGDSRTPDASRPEMPADVRVDRSQGELKNIEAIIQPIAEVEPAPMPVEPQKPSDEALLKQAMSMVEKLPAAEVQMGAAMYKDDRAPKWPDTSIVRMAGFGPDADQARAAAERKLLSALLQQIVPEESLTAHKPRIEEIMGSAAEYVRRGVQLGEGEAAGTHFVALELAPRASKLGHDLYMAQVPVRDIYDLVGRPSVGIDMPEQFDNKDAGVKESRLRRTQRALENALRQAGVTTVDVTGVAKEKQREFCDVLITGTSLATLRGSAPLPGGTQPVHVYNAEIEIDVQLSPTRRQIYNQILSLKPAGAEEVKTLGDFDRDEAAKKTLETLVQRNVNQIVESITRQWVELSGQVDYWVGVGGLTGGQDVLQVQEDLKAIPGVTKVIPRWYRDGTQYVGIVFGDTAEMLKQTFIKTGRYRVREQRGAMLVFDAVPAGAERAAP